MHATRFLIIGLAAAAVVGCGSEDTTVSTDTTAEPPARPRELPAAKQRQAFAAQQEISAYCRRRALSLQTDAPAPSSGEARDAAAATDRLVGLVRARPFELVQTGVDVRLYVGDLIEDLGNLSCDPGLVRRLEEGLG